MASISFRMHTRNDFMCLAKWIFPNATANVSFPFHPKYLDPRGLEDLLRIPQKPGTCHLCFWLHNHTQGTFPFISISRGSCYSIRQIGRLPMASLKHESFITVHTPLPILGILSNQSLQQRDFLFMCTMLGHINFII